MSAMVPCAGFDSACRLHSASRTRTALHRPLDPDKCEKSREVATVCEASRDHRASRCRSRNYGRILEKDQLSLTGNRPSENFCRCHYFLLNWQNQCVTM